MNGSYFDGVIGHDTIKKRFMQLIEKDHMPHAMIFAGLPGLGKTVMAVAVASAMVQRPVLTGWEEHPEQDILQDRDDVYFLAPVGTMLKVGQFRQLQEKLMLMGRIGGKRVCIIDHIETINKEFANRMLKILEEPPQDVYFILITNQADLLLPTIISRCALISFEPVDDEEMRAGLTRLYGECADGYEQAVLVGGGSVKAALNFLDGKDVSGVRYALDFLRFMATHTSPYTKWLTVSADFTAEETTDILRWIKLLLRDMFVLRAGANSQIRFQQYKKDLLQLLSYWSDAAIITGMKVSDEGGEAVLRHVNVKLVWDYICIQFQQAKGGI